MLIHRLSAWLCRISTGWVALLSLVVFILFSALVLPGQAAKAEMLGNGAGSPDTSFLYSSTDLYQMAEAYGDLGRQEYVRARLTFDVIWPFVYTFFLVVTISWVFGKSFERDSIWQKMNLVPLLAAGLDFLENFSASLVMTRYPQPTAVVDTLAPIFSLLKWLFVTSSFLLLLIGVLVGIWRWAKQRP